MAAKALSVAWICWTFLSWSLTVVMSPPNSGLPHVTTFPSAKIAAKALSVAWISQTFLSWSLTVVLSPPSSGLPHVTTLPSAKMAAKALSVAWICWTILSWSLRFLKCVAVATKFWIAPCDNHVTSNAPQSHRTIYSYFGLLCNSNAISTLKPRILKSFCWIQKATIGSSLRKRCPKDCCAFVFKSKTVLVGPSDRAAHRPLGNATFSRSCSILFILKGLHIVLSASIANVTNSL